MGLSYFLLLTLCAVSTMSQDVEIDAAHSSVCQQLPYLQHYCGSQIKDWYDCSKIAPRKPGLTGPKAFLVKKGAKVCAETITKSFNFLRRFKIKSLFPSLFYIASKAKRLSCKHFEKSAAGGVAIYVSDRFQYELRSNQYHLTGTEYLWLNT